MDSLTQLALGAGVGAAVLGRRIGPRKAALAGAVLGTLPDLDVFWPFSDPVDAFVLHRSATHSLLIQAMATPLLGEGLRRLFPDLRQHRWQAWAAVYLCLSTHALLDALTVYGTQLLWPLSGHPFGVGSVFIIDPVYTVPLLVALVWALCRGAWTQRFGRVLAAGLLLSTGYLGWSMAAQQLATSRAAAVLARAGVEPTRMLATPTPLNTLFWRVIAIDGGRYLNLYVPLLGGTDAVTAYAHPLGAGPECLAGNPVLDRLSRFAHGFVRAEHEGSAWRIADLRMGLTPNYVFRFEIADAIAGRASAAATRIRGARSTEGDVEWLLAGMLGEAAVRPAERPALVDLSTVRLADRPAAAAASC